MRRMYCSGLRPDDPCRTCTPAGLSLGAGMPMMVEVHGPAGSRPPRSRRERRPAALPEHPGIVAATLQSILPYKAARRPERTPTTHER